MIALDAYGGGSGGDVDLNGVYNQIADLSGKVNGISGSVSGFSNISSSISGFSEDISNLNSSVSLLSGSISNLNDTISLLNDTVSILGNSVSDFGNSIDAFRNDMSELYGMSEYVSTISDLITNIQTTVYQPYYLPATQMNNMYNASGSWGATRHYMNGIDLAPTITKYTLRSGPMHWYNHDSNGVFSSCGVYCNTADYARGIDVAGFSEIDKITISYGKGTIKDGDNMDSCSLRWCDIDVSMRNKIANGVCEGNTHTDESFYPYIHNMSAREFTSNLFQSVDAFLTGKQVASNTFTYCPVIEAQAYGSFMNNSVANGTRMGVENAYNIGTNTINTVSIGCMDAVRIAYNTISAMSVDDCTAITYYSNAYNTNTILHMVGINASNNTVARASVADCTVMTQVSNSFSSNAFVNCKGSRFMKNTMYSNFMCNVDGLSLNGCNFDIATDVSVKASMCDAGRFSTIHSLQGFVGRFSSNSISIGTLMEFTARSYMDNTLEQFDRATVNGFFILNNSFAFMNELCLKPQSTYGHMNNTFTNIKKLTFEGSRMANNYYKSIDELECDLLQYHDMTRTNGSFTVNYNYYVSSNFFYEGPNTSGSTHLIYDTDLKYNKLVSTFPESKLHVRELNLVPYVRSCMESLKDIANSTDPVIKFNQLSGSEIMFSLYPPEDLDTDLFVRTFKNNPYYYDFAKTILPYCMDAMWIVKSSSEQPAALERHTYSITFLNYIPTLGWPTHNPLKILEMITDGGGAKTDKCMNKTFYHYDKYSGCTEKWKNGGTVKLAYYPFDASSRSYITINCAPYTNETLSGYGAFGSTTISMVW